MQDRKRNVIKSCMKNMLKRPYPVIYKARDGKHYRVRYKVNRMELVGVPPHALQNDIENHILEELRSIV